MPSKDLLYTVIRRFRQLEQTPTQSRQSLHCSHTWSMEVDERSDQKSDM